MNNKIDDGGPAFPIPLAATTNGNGDPWVFDSQERCNGGMSLRDWFAGQALVAIPHIGCGSDLRVDEVAEDAYQLADAMIAARAKARQP